MTKKLIFLTKITCVNTKCEFTYRITNENVVTEYEHWKIKNPGPYTFEIHILKDNERWLITS